MIINTMLFNYRYDESKIQAYLDSSFKDDYFDFQKQYNSPLKIEEFEMLSNLIPTDLREAILYLTKDFFSFCNSTITLDAKKILQWKSLSSYCGEDLFVCCKMANELKNELTSFSWDVVLKPKDSQLENILKKGVSDNHFHLNGSASIAYLNFRNLVNSSTPYNFFQKTNFKKIKIKNEELENFKITCYRLYVLRLFLFEKILVNKNLKNEVSFDIYEHFFHEYRLSYFITMNLNEIKTGLNKHTNDYCSCFASNDSIVDGERALLYNLFYYYDDSEIQKWLPIYIVLKNAFRSFFVQRSGNVGLSNFIDFDSRKKLFLMDKTSKCEVYKSAIKNSLETKNLINLEIRIAPENKVNEYKNKIFEIKNSIDNIMKTNNSSYYFVYHFIKKKDEISDKFWINSFDRPRNYITRIEIEKQAKALCEYIKKDKANSSFVRGIDAANTEVSCRPEVFAPVFRELRAKTYIDERTGEVKNFINGITYHVGEDFTDIVDGLRAIDEAILFLRLRQGDRLGHCIALGLNVFNYYKLKYRTIIKNKQDYLDDLVWLKYKMHEFNIMDASFEMRMDNKIGILMSEIYSDNKYSFYDYFLSLKLRGDNPVLYKNELSTLETYFVEKYGRNSDNEGIEAEYYNAAMNNNSKELYFRYHYDNDAKIKGRTPSIEIIDESYIKIVIRIQECMRKMVYNTKIFIETNPTSNYVIGPINKYKDLPLLSFNKYKLEENYTNIPITINTDDQGIFNTCLYNEYAVLLNLLTSKEDELDEEEEYPIEKVYEYLDYLRQNSNDASFNKKN